MHWQNSLPSRLSKTRDSAMNVQPSSLVITGVGIITAIGQGKANFIEALLSGRTAFGYLKRPGREGSSDGAQKFIGAEIVNPTLTTLQPEHNRLLRNASLSTQFALLAALEAWQDAQLHTADLDLERVGLVIGGSNLQQREQAQVWQHHAATPQFVSPSYGLTLWDTDLMGVLSQALQIQGEGYSIGSASASGAMAIIHAARQIQSGQMDVSVAVGALFDLSSWECYGLRNLGAMGSTRFQDQPQAACRPFDRASDGFIYGEGSGVLILESAEHAQRRGAQVYGRLLGWGSALDGNRQANPNQAGEIRAMVAALQMAGLHAAQINYVNTHGTSSPLGDKTEVAALKAAGMQQSHSPAIHSLQPV
jgi:malonyl-ACP decarboxylase